MGEDIIVYKTRKLIYTIIFDFYQNQYGSDSTDFDLVIIESLKNIVEYLCGENYLSKKVRDNISNYLMQARDYKDENRKQRITIINEIIKIMNNQTEDHSLIFYRLELAKRRKDLKYLLKYPNSVIKEEIENVHDSICNDFYFLVSHTDDVTEEDFENNYLPYLKNSDAYYESLNAILEENPIVFKDEILYNRMMRVLNLNNELYKQDKLIINMNKKLLRKINKINK